MRTRHRRLPVLVGAAWLAAVPLLSAQEKAIDPRKDPEAALNSLTAVIKDARRPANERALAVLSLGRLLGLSKSMVSDETRIQAGLLTVGTSELLFGLMLRENVLPAKHWPGITRLLTSTIADPSPEIRDAVATVLRQCPTDIALPVWLSAVENRTPEIKLIAIKGLGELGAREVNRDVPLRECDGGSKVLPAILPALDKAAKSKDQAIQAGARDSRRLIDSACKAWAEDLAHADRVGDLMLDTKCLSAPVYGAALKTALPYFKARLRDPDYEIRLAAAHSVWLLEGSTEGSLHDLSTVLWSRVKVPRKATEDESRELRECMAKLDKSPVVDIFIKGPLDRLGPLAAPATPHLRRALKTDRESDLVYALECLARIGPGAAAAAPELTSLLGHQSDQVWFLAALSLARAKGGSEAAPLLRRKIDSIFGDERKDAALSLLLIDPRDAQALRTLGLPPDYTGTLLDLLSAEAVQKPDRALNAALGVLLARQSASEEAPKKDTPPGS